MVKSSSLMTCPVFATCLQMCVFVGCWIFINPLTNPPPCFSSIISITVATLKCIHQVVLVCCLAVLSCREKNDDSFLLLNTIWGFTLWGHKWFLTWHRCARLFPCGAAYGSFSTGVNTGCAASSEFPSSKCSVSSDTPCFGSGIDCWSRFCCLRRSMLFTSPHGYPMMSLKTWADP